MIAIVGEVDKPVIWYPLADGTRFHQVGGDAGFLVSVKPVARFGMIDSFLSRSHDGRFSLWLTDRTIERPIFEAIHSVSGGLNGVSWIDDVDGASALLSWDDDGTIIIWNASIPGAIPRDVLAHGKNADVLGLIWLGETSDARSPRFANAYSTDIRRFLSKWI